MHELSIATSVLDAVRAEMLRHPGTVPVKVVVRVGELAGVDPDALAFGFQGLIKGTEWDRLILEVQAKPREHRCPTCTDTFRVVNYNCVCPGCGSSRTECISGDELELAYVELEVPWTA